MFIRTVLERYVLFLTCSLFKCTYQMLFLMKTILNYFKLKEIQTIVKHLQYAVLSFCRHINWFKSIMLIYSDTCVVVSIHCCIFVVLYIGTKCFYSYSYLQIRFWVNWVIKEITP